MESFNEANLKNLYMPPVDSHKGQNGKVMVIGGSKLFHAASLWALSIASKIVDMVFYASVQENNEIVEKAKQEFRNGIVIPRNRIDDYIEESDAILIGPGLPREEGIEKGDDDTRELTQKLLTTYPHKKWVIDGGSLQVMDPEWLLQLKQTPILTPHHREFERLFNIEGSHAHVEEMAKKYHCVIVLKGPTDSISSPNETIEVMGGNAGMTKGGTGDVLAGLAAALYAKNDAFLAACAASFFNKKAGDELYKRVGYYFNSSDLVNEIPVVMKSYLSI